METMVSLVCAHCSEAFLRRKAEHSRSKDPSTCYCSNRCRGQSAVRRISVGCAGCGTVFERVPSAFSAGLDFCSVSCSVSHTNQSKSKDGVKEVACDDCQAGFLSSKFAGKIRCLDCRQKHEKIRGEEILNTTCRCGSHFLKKRSSTRKLCDACRREVLSKSGRLSGVSRSKNEIAFADMCIRHFHEVDTNAPIFNGWDADVIIHDLKIAVLWNGPWHRKKIKSKHSVLQVQNRDKIKIKEIRSAGYLPYVIDDPGKADDWFVRSEFSRFMELVRRDGFEPPTRD